MDNKASLRQKLLAMKMQRTSRNTIIKKKDKQKEKQEKQGKQGKANATVDNEKEVLIDSDLPPLEDY